MDLYDDVLTASSQPPESRTSSLEPPPEIRQEPPPKPNSKAPAILYTYSGLRNKRAAVYVGSFSWVSALGAQTSEGSLEMQGSLEQRFSLLCAEPVFQAGLGLRGKGLL